MAQVERTYENALKIIESRQRRARPNANSQNAASYTERVSLNSGTPDLRGTPSIVGMSEWLQMLGHSDSAINALNIIHVAGTKGKGSTCAFIESFLRAHGSRTGYPRKTGMYTSPHLIVPQERIRLNSEPMAVPLFTKYFFEVYDKLPQLWQPYDPAKSVVERGPRSLQLYALLAFHVFIREEIDVAVIETHSGGEYDATNVITKPVVTAITSLGMDHVQMLGPTIGNIAWHKAGIFKRGAVALSTIQDPEAAQVLIDRAAKVGKKVHVVNESAQLPPQLKPAVQRTNASLALAAANAFLNRHTSTAIDRITDQDVELGVQQRHWPGRFEIIPDGNRTWFLDAAHNDMSVKIAAEWFVEHGMELDDSASQILMFSHINELRDAVSVLGSLAEALREHGARMEGVIFTTYAESEMRNAALVPSDQDALEAAWKKLYPDSRISKEMSIRGAVDRARALGDREHARGLQVLVTGSQHLVGPALHILRRDSTNPT